MTCKQKKNQAHLVLCAECPQINRIKWAFSPHVKFRWKDWHWMCTLILCSWNSPSKQQCSEQFLKTTGSTFLPFSACKQHTGMELWQKYYPSEWHISETETRKLAKGVDSRQAPVTPLSLHPARAPKPVLSKGTDLILGYTPCGGTGGPDIFEDEVLRSGTNFSSALQSYR